MSYLETIPLETFNEVLFNLPASVIINSCHTNNYFNEICNNESFWEQYVTTNYDIDLLVDDLSLINGKKLLEYIDISMNY
jgi:hypothetical protein